MIKVKRLVEEAKLPIKAHDTDAGYDVHSISDITILAGQRIVVKTGISIELPNQGMENNDLYLRIAPRSGLAVNNGIDVLAGVIDRGYTGEIMVPLLNTSDEDYTITSGDRIAQLIPTMIYKSDIIEVTELSETERADGNTGSTGI